MYNYRAEGKEHLKIFIFSWRITALQCCVGFCHTTAWISHTLRSVVSDSLWPHGLQHARLLCPSPIPELAQTHVYRVSDAIQPSQPLSSPSSPVFNLSQHQDLFQWVDSASGGQSIGASASAWVLPKNIKDWFPLGLIGWISSQSKGLSRVFSNTIA